MKAMRRMKRVCPWSSSWGGEEEAAASLPQDIPRATLLVSGCLTRVLKHGDDSACLITKLDPRRASSGPKRGCNRTAQCTAWTYSYMDTLIQGCCGEGEFANSLLRVRPKGWLHGPADPEQQFPSTHRWSTSVAAVTRKNKSNPD